MIILNMIASALDRKCTVAELVQAEVDARMRDSEAERKRQKDERRAGWALEVQERMGGMGWFERHSNDGKDVVTSKLEPDSQKQEASGEDMKVLQREVQRLEAQLQLQESTICKLEEQHHHMQDQVILTLTFT